MTPHSLSFLWSSILCKGRLAQHQFSCTAHRQSFLFGGVLPPTLLCFPPYSTWTWIASIDIIDAFHLGLPCLCSYHHIPYALRIDVQQTLHILLSWFTFDLSNVIAWYVFCNSLFGVCPFFHGWWERPPRYSHSLVSIHGWRLRNITWKAHN